MVDEITIRLAIDCPCNCPWMILNPGAVGCELGRAIGVPITEEYGGEAKVEEGS